MQQLIVKMGLSQHFRNRRSLVFQCQWFEGGGLTLLECYRLSGSYPSPYPEADFPVHNVEVFNQPAPAGFDTKEAIARVLSFLTTGFGTVSSEARPIFKEVGQVLLDKAPWLLAPKALLDLGLPLPTFATLLDAACARVDRLLDPELMALRNRATALFDAICKQYPGCVESAPGMRLLRIGDFGEAYVSGKDELDRLQRQFALAPTATDQVLLDVLRPVIDQLDELIPAMSHDPELARKVWFALLPIRLHLLWRFEQVGDVLRAIQVLQFCSHDPQTVLLRCFAPVHVRLWDRSTAEKGLVMHLDTDAVQPALKDSLYFEMDSPF